MSQSQSGPDPISKLVANQLSTWKQDPLVSGGLLYVLNLEEELQFHAHSMGKVTELSSKQLKVMLLKARENVDSSWKTQDGGVGYSMFQSDRLVAFWLLYTDDTQDPNPAWKHLAQQFEASLSNILQSLEGGTPDFAQLVSALPATNTLPKQDPHPAPKSPGLHWESSRTRAPGRAKEDLTEKLLLDYKPLF